MSHNANPEGRRENFISYKSEILFAGDTEHMYYRITLVLAMRVMVPCKFEERGQSHLNTACDVLGPLEFSSLGGA